MHRSHGWVPKQGHLSTIFPISLPAARASQHSAVHSIQARRSGTGAGDHSDTQTTNEEEVEDDYDDGFVDDDDSGEDAADLLGGLSDDDPSSGIDTAGTSWYAYETNLSLQLLHGAHAACA